MDNTFAKVQKCIRCNRIYEAFLGKPTCPTCSEKENEQYNEVKAYIREHKGAGLLQVAQSCKVKSDIIIEWIKEERLVFPKEANVVVECEQCGTSILKGHYCRHCKKELVTNLQRAYTELEISKEKQMSMVGGAKMRFLNR